MATRRYKGNEGFNIDRDLFRERLQMLLDSRGYTKADLSRALDLSVSTVTRYFYESIPDTTALCLIADYFDVTTDWLLGRSNERWIKLPDEQQMLIDLYTVATPSDKLVIKTLLEKYANK